MKINRILAGISAFVCVIILTGCRKQIMVTEPMPVAEEATTTVTGSGVSRMQPRAIIYKTRGDYRNLVPITLDASKSRVVSYPAPTDLKGSEPTTLTDGYLLDNRGVGMNTAFTSYTYEEYSALKQVPSVGQLLKSIVDSDPMVEIYATDSARNSQNGVEFYNKIVESGFRECKRIK